MIGMNSDRVNGGASRRTVGFYGKRVHLIGIGGSGMSGAARLLMQCGATVSGSDLNQFAGAGELTAAGATVHFFHDAGHLRDDIDLVVHSAAIPESNPELAAARMKSLPVIRYAELLGEFTRVRKGVAISGTHGKSTTTALVAHMFREARLDPSFIVGAESAQLGGSSGVGAGKHFVVESCEYARSFLHMTPHSAAILNIEADHLDCYRDIEDIVSAFSAFGQRVSRDGVLVVNYDDRLAKRAARDACCRVETFGFGAGADWHATSMRAQRGRFTFRLMHNGRFFANCGLKLAGRHNASNAIAAAALAHEAGATPSHIVKAMATFEGVRRRMTFRGCGRGVTIVDDYAHHPTEIKATLQAVRSHYAPKRTWVVFQPHQASRTRLLIDEFSQAFEDADFVLVPDIYSVRDTEEDRLAIRSSGLVERLCSSGKASRYLPSFEEVCSHLAENVSAGDVVVTMGAGDVWKVADALVGRVC